jgi:hypothetical protein
MVLIKKLTLAAVTLACVCNSANALRAKRVAIDADAPRAAQMSQEQTARTNELAALEAHIESNFSPSWGEAFENIQTAEKKDVSATLRKLLPGLKAVKADHPDCNPIYDYLVLITKYIVLKNSTISMETYQAFCNALHIVHSKHGVCFREDLAKQTIQILEGFLDNSPSKVKSAVKAIASVIPANGDERFISKENANAERAILEKTCSTVADQLPSSWFIPAALGTAGVVGAGMLIAYLSGAFGA